MGYHSIEVLRDRESLTDELHGSRGQGTDAVRQLASVERRHLVATGLGVAGGLCARVMQPTGFQGDPAGSTILALLWLAVVSVLMAVNSRGPKGALRHQIDNALLWVGFGIGWALLPDRFYPGNSDTIELTVAAGVVSALVGGAITWLRNRVVWKGSGPSANAAADANPLQAT